MKKKKKMNKKSKSKVTRFLLCMMLLCASAGLIYSGAKELRTTAQIRLDIQEDNEESAALDEKKAELETTKENLTNPDYIEYLARGKYLVTKDGEQVFKFSESDE